MAVDDAAEILESPHIVATDLIAVGIHAAELPLSHRVAVLGGEFERPQPGLGVASRSAWAPERKASTGVRACLSSGPRNVPDIGAFGTATVGTTTVGTA